MTGVLCTVCGAQVYLDWKVGMKNISLKVLAFSDSSTME